MIRLFRHLFHRNRALWYWEGRGYLAGVAVGPFYTEAEARERGPAPLPAPMTRLVKVTA